MVGGGGYPILTWLGTPIPHWDWIGVPHCGQTDEYQIITFPRTSYAGGKIYTYQYIYTYLGIMGTPSS